MEPQNNTNDIFLDQIPVQKWDELIRLSNQFSQSSLPTANTNLTLVAQDFASSNYKANASGWIVKSNGDVEFSSGTFRGFISASTIDIGGSDATSFHIDVDGNMWLGASTFASAPFKVSNAGALTATGATISGDITATSGTIGGFTITATEFYGGIIKTDATVEAGANGVIMDTDGLRGYNSTLGLVFDLPTDGSPPEFSSGVISESVFEINTNAILRTSSTVGDGTASSAGILINDTGLYACEANQDLSDANIKILVDGTGVFNANIRGGQTDFNTGVGYFLGLSGGDYKFSVGDPSGTHLTWNGEDLVIKGSFDVGTGGLINNAVYTVANLPIAPTSVGFNNASAYE